MRLCRRRSKKISKLRDNGLGAGNSPLTGEFPAQSANYAEMFPSWTSSWMSWISGMTFHISMSVTVNHTAITRLRSYRHYVTSKIYPCLSVHNSDGTKGLISIAPHAFLDKYGLKDSIHGHPNVCGPPPKCCKVIEHRQYSVSTGSGRDAIGGVDDGANDFMVSAKWNESMVSAKCVQHVW